MLGKGGASRDGVCAALGAGSASIVRTASTNRGSEAAIGPAEASNQWEALRKYSKPGGSGVASRRNETNGRFLELARSISRKTCCEQTEWADSTTISNWA